LAIEAVATHDTTWLRIHPFADGNGRAARVLANWMLARYWHPAGTVTGRPDGSRGRHHPPAIATGDHRSLTVHLRKRLMTARAAGQEQKQASPPH